VFKKSTALLALALLVVAVYAVGLAGAADDLGPYDATVSVDVLPGYLTLGPSDDTTLTAVTLTGSDQTATGDLDTLTVTDARGTGVGWYLTMSATDFDGTAGTAVGKDPIPATGFRISSVTLSAVGGSTAGIDDDTGALDIPLKVIDSEAPNGRGSYTADVELELDVPAEAYEGTYASTLTQTLISY
jgi:hypothetical protein